MSALEPSPPAPSVPADLVLAEPVFAEPVFAEPVVPDVEAVVILAAGAGTRMKSALPKVLHPIGGRSLLGHAVAAARGLNPADLVVVVGHGREQVQAHVAEFDSSARLAVQTEQLGTGHAVLVALDALPEVVTGTVVVTYGDVPLLQAQTLHELLTLHRASANAATVLSAVHQDPTGYGRIVRATEDSTQVAAIVEQKDATAEERAITEVNSGIYVFDVAFLRAALARIGTDNAQGELYLTDVLEVARADNLRTGALLLADRWQSEGANDRAQLAALGRELNTRVVHQLMVSGVTVLDPATTWVDVTAHIEPDVTLLPGTQVLGRTTIAAGATIGPDTTLVDCVIGPAAAVIRSHATGARLDEGAQCGPFTFLRPGAVLGPGARAGAFVEVKSATIGAGSKVPHLSYVGDADIGAGVNIGAATIFVNYDGVNKHRTVVGDHARIGSDTMLVAPLEIGAGAYTAAGSVITSDVPPGAIAVARGKQRNVEGWVQRRRAGSASAAAADQALSQVGQTVAATAHSSDVDNEGTEG